MSNRKDRFTKWLDDAGVADDDQFEDLLRSVWDAPLLHAVPDPSLWTEEDILLYSEHTYDACSGAVWSPGDDEN